MDTTWVKVVLLIVAAILIFSLAPLATIWSLNTLFGLSISYTLKTWAAAGFLLMVIGAAAKS